MIELINVFESTWIEISIALYVILEILFYWRYKYLAKQANENIHPYLTQPPITDKQCEFLTYKAMEYGGLSKGGYKGYLSKWFNNCNFCEIYEENMREWLKWAFFVELPHLETNETHNIHYNSKSQFHLNSKIKKQ